MSIASGAREAQERIEHKRKWDSRFMAVAEMVASWSKDPGTHVGACMVYDKVIVATGYNGLPRQLRDVGLENRDSKLSRTVHAEMNAILNTFRTGGNPRGCTLYVTPLSVCDRCAVHIIQAGIVRVVVKNPNDLQGGARLEEWERAGSVGLRYFAEAGVEVDCI